MASSNDLEGTVANQTERHHSRIDNLPTFFMPPCRIGSQTCGTHQMGRRFSRPMAVKSSATNI